MTRVARRHRVLDAVRAKAVPAVCRSLHEDALHDRPRVRRERLVENIELPLPLPIADVTAALASPRARGLVERRIGHDRAKIVIVHRRTERLWPSLRAKGFAIRDGDVAERHRGSRRRRHRDPWPQRGWLIQVIPYQPKVGSCFSIHTYEGGGRPRPRQRQTEKLFALRRCGLGR
jgi:hypothetical protein